MTKNVLILLTVTILFQISCRDDNGIDNLVNYAIDTNTMATPKGGRLKPAQDGPVRSALGQPEIDLANFKLTISGLIDSSFTLSWQEIQQWHSVYSNAMLMYCVEGWEVIGNWKGILIKDLLHKASVQSEGKHVLFRCVEGYATALPIAYIEKYNVMLAYEVNGEPLKDHDGFPLRLIAFGKYGYKWAKWVNSLQVISESEKGYWERWGYSDRADVPLQRRQYYEGEQKQPFPSEVKNS